MDQRGLETIHNLEGTVMLVANLLAAAAAFSLASSICLVMYLVQKLLDYRAKSSLDVHLQQLARTDFGNAKRGRVTAAISIAFVLHVLACGSALLRACAPGALLVFCHDVKIVKVVGCALMGA